MTEDRTSGVDGRRLPPEALRAAFDEADLQFDCTDELTPLAEFIGQDRAIRSLQFGLGLHQPGYNIFVTGLSGTGKTTAILDYVRQHAEALKEDARDWLYVYNFEDPDSPNAISLPAGLGRALRDDCEHLLNTVRSTIVQVFQSDEYERQRREILDQGQHQAQALIDDARSRAEAAGFFFRVQPSGVQMIPLKDGRPMTPEEFHALPAEEQRRLSKTDAPIHQLVNETAERVRGVEREIAEAIQTLDRQVVEAIVKTPFDVLDQKYASQPEVAEFLTKLREHTLENADAVLRGQEAAATIGGPAVPQADPLFAFHCNLFVDSSDREMPPIILEPNPNWTNLFGRIDRKAIFGTYISDHTMLKPGAVHRANGGYLILNFADLATKPGAWDGLKRILKTGEVRLEDPMEQYGMLTPQGLRPEPIPVDLKLVITGDPLSYFVLSALDEDFWEMFKVKADFDYQIPRTMENSLAYAGFVCAVCQRHELRHFDRAAVARLIEHGSRLVEDQEKLSGRFGRLRDIVVEADHWAAIDSSERVSGEHVTKAIEEREYRLNLVEERLREMLARGTLIVDVTGSVTGQVNGLAVMQMGDYAFGRPSRITASVQLGQRGVVSIDRESQLSGKIHDKGVLTLAGFLGASYGHNKPLSLSATVSFEQGYEPVDGDSSSLAETCALLSALAGVPLRQDLAMTGSVNQKGEVQPIGGVTLKIEGFHDACRESGFTGQQGVIIPSRNRKNLMLRQSVLDSVEAGQFHVYEVDSVNEAMELLTGLEAGERQPDGTYPEGTINDRVDREVRRMGEVMRRFGRGPASAEDAEDSGASTSQPPEDDKPDEGPEK
ncbi:MAG TPA: ATP-binding protein [Dehalococcoidia bacterium]